MIGNEIEYNDYGYNFSRSEPFVKTGIVVDAYTDMSGIIKGSGDNFLGFGSAKVEGSTKSKRMYKIQTSYGFDTIQEWQLIKIIRFANQFTEEKFKTE